MQGNGEQAYDYYRAFMPSAYNDRAEIRQVEPYVHCQTTYSKYNVNEGASARRVAVGHRLVELLQRHALAARRSPRRSRACASIRASRRPGLASR